jgi:hypothetical protein
MERLKLATYPDEREEQASPGRRSFVCRLGAGVSAVLAAAVPGMAGRRTGPVVGSGGQVDDRQGVLEDELAIRRLHERYEMLLDDGRYQDVVELFAEDAEVVFNGGVFEGRGGGVRRLFVERFRPGLTGKRMEVPPGLESEVDRPLAVVTVAADRQSAEARFAYSIQVGARIAADNQLARMASLHGEGFQRWWEGGSYEASYVKGPGDGGWRIERLEYRARSRADYRRGGSRARPISVRALSELFPKDAAGPDRLA